MKKYIWFLLLGAVLFSSCDKDEDLGESLIDTSTPLLNEVDQWIRDNYTTPYNIEIKYRWDDSEVDNSKALTPPRAEDVIPFLEKIKELWIAPYAKEGGLDFVKSYIPKQIVLVGSHNYNPNGSIVLGQAEGGRKITIFDLNYIDVNDVITIMRALHTIHHEFAHILHQKVLYPIEYQTITTEYTTTWFNFSDTDARQKGFITAYSMLNPNEDFVEMVSEFLLMTNEDWNALIDGIKVYALDEHGYRIFDWETFTYVIDEEKTRIAKEKFRKKESIIANYFLQIWKIDIYALQERINEKLAE